jgi:long-chain acyl-CoA synthetase
VGRSKETIVLLGGENVEPVPIENIISGLPMVEHCMVVGQDQKSLGVLIVPRPDYFKEISSDLAVLAKNEEVRKTILDAVKNAISTENGFKSFEKIQECRLLPKTFELGDELSGKLSVKRHIVTEKYKNLIDDMYR